VLDTGHLVAIDLTLGVVVRSLSMQSGVGGYQAANVTAFRSERIVLTVKRDERRHKVVQIIFGRDGSLL
jgi:hypothetical protein